MLLARPLIVDGEMWGTIYTCEYAGDGLEKHVHTEETNHITIVTCGGVKLAGHPDYEGREVLAKHGGPGEQGGTIINWKVGEPHSIKATIDGTVFINIRKK